MKEFERVLQIPCPLLRGASRGSARALQHPARARPRLPSVPASLHQGGQRGEHAPCLVVCLLLQIYNFTPNAEGLHFSDGWSLRLLTHDACHTLRREHGRPDRTWRDRTFKGLRDQICAPSPWEHTAKLGKVGIPTLARPSFTSQPLRAVPNNLQTRAPHLPT